MKKLTLIVSVILLLVDLSPAQDSKIKKWGFYEISLPGPVTGNPFNDIEFSAVFKNGEKLLNRMVSMTATAYIKSVSCRIPKGHGLIEQKVMTKL